MLTTKKLLSMVKKQVKAEHGTATVYRMAKEIGVSRPAVDNWLDGKPMNDECARKTAVFLNLDPEYVMMCVAAERAQDTPCGKLYQHIADRIKPAIAAGFCTFLLVSSYTTTISPFFA